MMAAERMTAKRKTAKRKTVEEKKQITKDKSQTNDKIQIAGKAEGRISRMIYSFTAFVWKE
jgi:hypothetical protein